MARRKSRQQRVPNLASDNRIARWCGHQKLDRDPVTHSVRGIIPQALELRLHLNESYISASWLEFHSGDDLSRLRKVAAVYRADGRRLGPNGGFALLNVGAILDAGTARSRELRVTNRPSRADPAYAKVEGLPQDNSDMVLLSMLCDACRGVYLMGDIDGGGSA